MSQNEYHRDLLSNNLQISEENRRLTNQKHILQLVLRETWTPQQTLSVLDIFKQDIFFPDL